MTSLDYLAALASEVALAAADLQRRELATARRFVGTKSSPTDLVTEVDQACEELLVSGIVSHRPEDAILGEEGANRQGSSGVRWIIDPLDGTTNFVYGHPGFGVSVAVEVNGTVEVGVVVDTMARDLFTAQRSRGSWLNGRQLTPRVAPDLSHALVATGFSYNPDRRRRQAAVLEGLLPRVRDIRRMGAAAVDLCSVACGRVDCYYEKGLEVWDHAAGVLIAREAGALVTDFSGGEPSGAGVVAAAPSLAGDLLSVLRDLGAEKA